MRPLAPHLFGPSGLHCIFASDDIGSSSVGYIIKQVGANRFIITNDSVTKTCILTQTMDDIAGLPGSVTPGTCTFLLAPFAGGVEHVRAITARRCSTVEGKVYAWHLGNATKKIAQIITPGGGHGPSGPAVNYIGPLDIVPNAFIASSSARSMASAMRGTTLFAIYNGTKTRNFSSDMTTGLAPVSLITSFIGSGTGYYTRWNDQSGNGRHTFQSANPLQPQCEVSGIGSLPTVNFPGARTLVTSGNVTFPTGGMSFYLVAQRIAGHVLGIPFAISTKDWTPDIYCEPGEPDLLVDYRNTAVLFRDSILPDIDDGNPHVYVGGISAAGAVLYIDGVEQDVTSSTLADAGQAIAPFIDGDDSPDGTDVPWEQYITERAMWATLITPAQAQDLCANAMTAFGF